MRWWILVLFLLLAPVVVAEPFHITLLAVHEDNGTFRGSTANLFFELKSGDERVFLDTFPLTKIDTQISTRFAKEIACNYFDLKCRNYDFIYTIRADSSIIGGPSAGASIAALTTAGVLNLDVKQNVAVTGTINSGGLIGPVGGLKAKIEAAESVGIDKVLIPAGTAISNISNKTINLIEYGEEIGVKVVEVLDLNEVVFHLTGSRLLDNETTVSIDPFYRDVMKDISERICKRSGDLNKQLQEFKLNLSERGDLTNRTARASAAAIEEAYYSAASYCFGLNIILKTLLYDKQNFSDAKIQAKVTQLEVDIERFAASVRERELLTITDLQTYSIVLERLNAARDLLADFNEFKTNRLLAFAEERFFTARVWSLFFQMDGKSFEINNEVLRNSCIRKIQEVKERYQYVILFAGANGLEDEMKEAEEQLANGEYAQCLILASQAKASANAVLSTLGVESSGLDRLVDTKLFALEKLISRTINRRAFPILAYSYYEYSKSLKQYDPGAALLYSEYALELSNLDIYFKESKRDEIDYRELEEPIIFFTIGLGVGFLITFLLFFKKK